jgi:hypothetical protein
MAKEIKKEIEDRIKVIEGNMKSNNIWEDMKSVAIELFDLLSYHNEECGVIKRIEMNPNDMTGGSINYYFTTLPENILLKLWHDSGNFYMSLFRKIEGAFDQQLSGTFNVEGVLVLKDLDEFENRILDFVANEIFNAKNKVILK